MEHMPAIKCYKCSNVIAYRQIAMSEHVATFDNGDPELKLFSQSSKTAHGM